MSAVMNDRLPRPRITVEEYYRMDEVGLFAPDSRTELIEGEVIEMAPIGSLHASVINRLQSILFPAVGNLARLRVRSPVRFDNYSELLPDLAVVLPRKDFYRAGHPGPEDTLLIVEVSQSTLRFDRDVKIPLYSRNRVAEVWIVDLQHEQMHFFRTPQERGYADAWVTDDPKVVALAAMPELKVDLSGLFES